MTMNTKAFNKSILIVDDQVDIRQTLKQVFVEQCAEEKLMICESGDGMEATMRLAHQKFDVLVLDIKLPKKDGLQVLRDISKQKDRTFYPELIVLISGHFPEELKEKLKGATLMVVSKPFSSVELVNEIKRRWDEKALRLGTKVA